MTIDGSLGYVSAHLGFPGVPIPFVGGIIGFSGVERIRACIVRDHSKIKYLQDYILQVCN